MLAGGERVTVDVDSPAGGRATFRLPALPVSSGDQVLQRMLDTMGALISYRLDETLTAGLGTTVDSTYTFAAPNSFEVRTLDNGTTYETVWIASTRYTRQGDGAWKVEQGAPAPSVPTYIWDSFTPYRDIRVVGHANIGGTRTTILAFAGGDEQLPAWFRLWVDDQGYVQQAKMRAPGHFMDDTYQNFNAAITILPPKGANG